MKVTALKRDHSCGRDGRRGAEWRSNVVRSVLLDAGRKHSEVAVGQRNRDVGLGLPQPIAVARMLVAAFDPTCH